MVFQVGKSEAKNLICSLYKPRITIGVFDVLVKAIVRRITSRFFEKRRKFYPKTVLKLANKKNYDVPELKKNNSYQLNISALSKPYRLKLAIGYIEFCEKPNWRKIFSDDEQFVSLHRWNWLIRGITDEDVPVSLIWGEQLVRSWLNEFGPLPLGLASESYTVGERISNICIFERIHHGNWSSIPVDLAMAVQKMALHLVDRIEYQSGDLTSNHVVNNGRALLIAGHSLGLKNLIDLGRELIRERLPVLVSGDGFLREGSSHYQLLFARWLVECWLVVYEGRDNSTLKILEPQLKTILVACQFFFVSDSRGRIKLPTFGDVSPDCEPEWLVGTSFVSVNDCNSFDASLGWPGLIRKYFGRSISKLPLPPSKRSVSWTCYPDDGWFRLDYNDWVAIWHIKDSTGASIGSHAHHDFCSLVLYYKGKEVLIDPGRLNYDMEPVSSIHSKSAKAHSSILLENLGPMLSTRDRFLPNSYREAKVLVTWENIDDKRKLVIKHNGFSRIGLKGMSHSRIFCLDGKSVSIHDHVKGSSIKNLDITFQFPDMEIGPPLKDMGIKLTTDLDTTTFISNWETKGTFTGWCYPSYGVKAPAWTFHAKGRVELPFNCCSIISVY